MPRKTLPVGELVFKFQFHNTRENDRLQELLDAGIRIVRDDEKAKQARHAEQIAKAEAAGLEPFRFQRKEAGKGEQVPDWGIAIFEASNGAHNVNVKMARQDVEAISGMKLVDIDIFQRMGDRNRYFLRVTYARDDRQAFRMISGQQVLLNEFFAATWGHVHVWVNEAGANINVVCLSERDDDVVFEGEAHDLRVRREGRLITAPKQADWAVTFVGD